MERAASGVLTGHGDGVKDVTWVRPDGEEMTLADWQKAENRVLGALLHCDASDEVDERGRLNRGDTLLLLVNAGRETVRFQLPAKLRGVGSWFQMLSTADSRARRVKDAFDLAASSLALLRYTSTR